MLVYWCMYALPALGTLAIGNVDPDDRRPRMGLLLLLVLFAVLIGLREQVGTDWFNYLRTVNRLTYTSFAGTFAYKDPAFGIVTWLSTRMGLGIYGANCVCGLILMLGLARFARAQPDAWLAVTASVPYLVIVVGMGYVRQAAAIGFVLFALLAFERHRYGQFTAWMIAAALFHGPALCLLPLALMVLLWDRRELLLPVGLAGGLLFAVLLKHRMATFYSTYIDAQYDSSGALIRLAMNAVPAIILLAARDRFAQDPRERRLWILFAFVSLLLLLLIPISPSSTALDRIGLYFIPLQLYLFGRLPCALGGSRRAERAISYGVVLYYAAVLFIWLDFASNAHAWLPYRFAPFA